MEPALIIIPAWQLAGVWELAAWTQGKSWTPEQRTNLLWMGKHMS